MALSVGEDGRGYAVAVTILDAAFWAVSLVLVASGATKVADPTVFAGALVAFGLPAPARTPALVIGLGEILLGLGALSVGGPALAALVALSYLGFTGVVVVARRRGLATCGCFGVRSGRPSAVHAVLNGVSAAVAGAAAALAPVAVWDGLSGLSAAAAVLVGAAVVAAAGLIVVADTR